MAADHFCLRWNNYQSNMVTELDSLRSDEDLVDVTLSCEGHLLKAHKVILSACSSYFRNVFKENPCKHPVVILKDVNYEDVEALLSFVYQGVVYISEKKLASFLQTAELLQIRGLTGAATTMKDGSFNDTTSTKSKTAEKSTVPPPPQLLTANLLNSWKHQSIINTTTSSSMKSPSSNPPSPSLPVAAKRRKCVPSKVTMKENLECSDTNSNQGYSETESDLVIVKQEKSDAENRDPEDDCNSVDDISREESSREGNPSFYDNLESDETEEEVGEIRNRSAISNCDKSGNSNASCSSLFGLVPNFSSQSSAEQNSSASGSHLAQCGNCPHCGQTYSNQSALKYHVRLMHCDLTNQFSCYLCPMSFAHRDDYKTHMWEIHKVRRDTRLGRRPCPLCQKIISNKSNLLKHMRIRHSDEHNPAGCTICNKVFKNKYSLRAHINIYHKEMNAGTGSLSLYSPHLPSTEYNTHHHHHQHQQQSNNTSSHSDYLNSQPSVSLSYSATSSNYNLVSSSVGNELSPYELVKENVMNQFNVSNLPLT